MNSMQIKDKDYTNMGLNAKDEEPGEGMAKLVPCGEGGSKMDPSEKSKDNNIKRTNQERRNNISNARKTVQIQGVATDHDQANHEAPAAGDQGDSSTATRHATVGPIIPILHALPGAYHVRHWGGNVQNDNVSSTVPSDEDQIFEGYLHDEPTPQQILEVRAQAMLRSAITIENSAVRVIDEENNTGSGGGIHDGVAPDNLGSNIMKPAIIAIALALVLLSVAITLGLKFLMKGGNTTYNRPEFGVGDSYLPQYQNNSGNQEVAVNPMVNTDINTAGAGESATEILIGEGNG